MLMMLRRAWRVVSTSTQHRYLSVVSDFLAVYPSGKHKTWFNLLQKHQLQPYTPHYTRSMSQRSFKCCFRKMRFEISVKQKICHFTAWPSLQFINQKIVSFTPFTLHASLHWYLNEKSEILPVSHLYNFVWRQNVNNNKYSWVEISIQTWHQPPALSSSFFTHRYLPGHSVECNIWSS